MNCTDLIASIGFSCKQISPNTMRLWSPFTYGNDGHVVGLYLEKSNAGYRITDDAEALMHSASMGINITKRRIDLLKRVCGESVMVSDSGVISATANDNNLTDALSAVLNATLAVSHYEIDWMPRIKSESFTQEVAAVLEVTLGERLKKNVVVTGASGHQIEIPLVIEKNKESTYIQPVAYGDDRVDWDNVYRGLGKMLDLKSAGAEDQFRTIVIDDRSKDDELTQAVTLLTHTATVVNYSRLDNWARRLAA